MKNNMVLASITFIAVVAVVDDDVLTVFCSRLL